MGSSARRTLLKYGEINVTADELLPTRFMRCCTQNACCLRPPAPLVDLARLDCASLRGGDRATRSAKTRSPRAARAASLDSARESCASVAGTSCALGTRSTKYGFIACGWKEGGTRREGRGGLCLAPRGGGLHGVGHGGLRGTLRMGVSHVCR